MVADSKTLLSEEIIPAPEASDAQLRLAHSAEYISQIREGTLPRKLEREMGLPWSAELAKRVRHTVGATILAGRTALEEGIACTGGGGTHHAQWDRPQGYCIFNDIIVCSRVLQQERLVSDILVIDCDVHQGNGTALIAADDPSIFTFSIHCEKNFPVRKAKSDLDIGLPIDTGDRLYLQALKAGLTKALETITPDLVIYLAGADPFSGDRLGKLALSKAGLKQRDEYVLNLCTQNRWPIVVTLAGGYGRNVNDTVELYYQTIQCAQKMQNDCKRI
ncbi:MAG: acetoin utilization deacetylase AcuC-like enzyme [Cellvibrionaceae bacterium]|jgi:acetoin utilization deacetylase AcuC-like enzyme